MTHHRIRKCIAVGFAGAIALLTLSSSAYACTWFLGTVQTRTSTGTGTITTQGGVYGNAKTGQITPDMGYCQTPNTSATMSSTGPGTVTMNGYASTCTSNGLTLTSQICGYTEVTAKVCPSTGGTEQYWSISYIPGYWNGVSLQGQDCGMGAPGITVVQQNIPSHAGGLNLNDATGTWGPFTSVAFTPTFSSGVGHMGVCLSNNNLYNSAPQSGIDKV